MQCLYVTDKVVHKQDSLLYRNIDHTTRNCGECVGENKCHCLYDNKYSILVFNDWTDTKTVVSYQQIP